MEVMEPKNRETAVAIRRPTDFTDQLIEPFAQLRNEVDRLFDSFPLRLPTLRLGRLNVIPAAEVTETDKSYKVTVELPGMSPENVEVTFDDGLLRIAGEKKEEREKNERGFRLAERTYGSFERLIELPQAADGNGIEAKLKDGLLTVTVPKNEKAQRKPQRIAVKTES